jgi:hypothetical protein
VVALDNCFPAKVSDMCHSIALAMRIISICVTHLKVAKAGTIVTITVAGVFALNLCQ